MNGFSLAGIALGYLGAGAIVGAFLGGGIGAAVGTVIGFGLMVYHIVRSTKDTGDGQGDNDDGSAS